MSILKKTRKRRKSISEYQIEIVNNESEINQNY